MRWVTVFFMVVWLVNASASGSGELSALNELQWKNRILIVELVDSKKAVYALSREQQGVAERDLVWFVITSEKVVSNYPSGLSDEFKETIKNYHEGKDSLVLIGKDGAVKRDEKITNEHLPIAAIFKQIDAMPMRVLEMQEDR